MNFPLSPVVSFAHLWKLGVGFMYVLNWMSGCYTAFYFCPVIIKMSLFCMYGYLLIFLTHEYIHISVLCQKRKKEKDIRQSMIISITIPILAYFITGRMISKNQEGLYEFDLRLREEGR